MKKYTLIYADPPWSYRDKAADGNQANHKVAMLAFLFSRVHLQPY